MDMKWTPIIDGDLSGIPQDGEYLFTVLDERTGEPYVTTAWVIANDGELEVRWLDICGLNSNEAKNAKAWAELPEPYKPTPDKCFKCNHGKLQHDESSDNWFECELLQRDVPPNGKPEDCPLDR